MDIKIFRKVFKNTVLGVFIFDQVHSIHKSLQLSSFKWLDVKKNAYLLCSYGYLDLFKQFYQNSKCNFGGRNLEEYLVVAAKRNHLDVLKFILDIYRERDYDNSNMNDLWYEALSGGYMEIMEYLYSIRDENSEWKWNEYLSFPASARSGRLDICKWFAERFPHAHGRDSPVSIDTSGFQNQFYEGAVMANSVDVLEWGFDFYQKDYSGIGYYIWDIWECAIIHTVNIDVLNSMFNNQAIRNRLYKKSYKNVPSNCVFSSDRETIDWFLSKNISFPSKDIFLNIYKRDIEFIHYFYTSVTKTTTKTEAKANSTIDSKEFVEWFRNGCLQDNINAMDYAMQYDNFNLVKWMHEKTDIIGSDRALDNVAEHGCFEILKWFTENKRVEKISDEVLNDIKINRLEIEVYILLNRTESFSRNVLQDLLLENRLDLIEQLTPLKHRKELDRCGAQTDINLVRNRFYQLERRTQRYIIHHYKQAIPKDIIDKYIEKEDNSTEFQQLKHLIQSNHQISSDTFQKIIYRGNMEIIRLIKETSTWNTLKSRDLVFYVSDIEVAKYLVENGIYCNIDDVAGDGDLETIMTMFNYKNCIYSSGAINCAIQNGSSMNIIYWMLNNLDFDLDDISEDSSDPNMNQAIKDFKFYKNN